jgi:pSer/pThr/pTyr-binding forkhead associated (FHA) protein
MDELIREFVEEAGAALEPGTVRLEIRNGPEDGRVFPIVAETVRIGRQLAGVESANSGVAVANFVIRSDKAISREHCELTALSSATFLLKDLASRFGTELNGERITAPAPCRAGDTITIGDTTLLLRDD